MTLRLRIALLALVCTLIALLSTAPASAHITPLDPPPSRAADSPLGLDVEFAYYTYRLSLREPRLASENGVVRLRRASDPSLRWKGRPLQNFGGVEVYDMRARQWVPELGVFLSIDEYAFHDARSTLWGWPGQNPVRDRDPSGRCGPLCAVGVGAGAGAIIGAGIYAATTDNFTWGGLGGAALEGGVIGGAFGLHPAAGVLALGTLGVANENDLWKFGLAGSPLRRPTTVGRIQAGSGEGAGSCVKAADANMARFPQGERIYSPVDRVPHVAVKLPDGTVLDPTLRGNLEAYGAYAGDIPAGTTSFTQAEWDSLMQRLPERAGEPGTLPNHPWTDDE